MSFFPPRLILIVIDVGDWLVGTKISLVYQQYLNIIFSMLLKSFLVYSLITSVLILTGLIRTASSLEPVTAIIGIGALVTAIVGVEKLKCHFNECCNDRWITNNIDALKFELENNLYGQHLVKKAVVSQIFGHVQNHHPQKALALSFHGPTGTGKNHVSRMIAEALYKKGLDSEYVRLMVVTKEFPHQHRLPQYKDRLRDIIQKQVKKCPKSLFIFDEMDKMPGGLIDSIKPYVDYHDKLDGVDYRRAIFIFLSNTGEEAVTEHMLQRWRDGLKREQVGLSEIENVIAKAALNSEAKGGLWHSEIVSRHLISAYIPFLPLERRHIRQCIKDMMVWKRYFLSHSHVVREKVDAVMAELTFYPKKEPLFSVTGCKRIADKVDYVMA